MNKLKLIIFIGIIAIVFGCKNASNSENEKIVPASELKVGEKFSNLTLSDVSIDSDAITLKFSDEIEVEGTMFFEQSPTMISIDASILKGKIDLNGNTIDLSTYKVVSFINYSELAKYIPLEWRDESTTDDWQLKSEKNGEIKVKVKIKDITFCNDDMLNVTAKITDVLSFNGEKEPKIVTDSEPKSIKAKFEMIILGTDGGWTQFIDDAGNSYLFFDDGNEDLHENIKDVKHNSTEHQYKNTWFDIEYKTVSLPFYDGGTGNTVFRAVEVISTMKVSNGTTKSKKSQIADLTKMEFGAPEAPEWRLKFYNDYMLFSREYESIVLKLSYINIKENKTEIKIKSGNITDPEDERDYLIIIKKEHCEVSMGYEDFPYSMVIESEGKAICSGCGKYIK